MSQFKLRFIFVYIAAISLFATPLQSQAVTTNGTKNEIYEQEGIGNSDTKNKACEEALLYAKKDALDAAGTIIRASVKSNTEVVNNSVNKVASVDFLQLSNGIIKVIHKSYEVTTDKDGRYTCIVKAKLSVNTEAVLTHNKMYEGQLPVWAITPPKVLGKITIIGNDATLDGAFVKALFKFVEKSRGAEVKIEQLKEGISNAKNLSELAASFKYYNRNVTEPISSNTQISWERKFAMATDGEGADEKVIRITELNVNLKFDDKSHARSINYYQATKAENDSVNLPSDVESNVNVSQNSTATISMMFDDIKKSGFDVEYEQVILDNKKEWFVMLIGKEIKQNNSVDEVL